MAASSSSFLRWGYHVFPSFCGEDVRRNFVSHFHKELQLKGINAFSDHGIKRGRSIGPELKQDPSDVRKQTGAFGQAFEKTCLGRTIEERQRWKRALTDVANVSGNCSGKWENEASMIEKIVADVLEELNGCTPSKDFDDLVGLDAHVANLSSMLCLESNEVMMIGIWGPLGIGKTTIARALYNQLSSANGNFQLNLFMENDVGAVQTWQNIVDMWR